MTTIQAGSNYWIDGFGRHTGGTIVPNVRPDILNAAIPAKPALWGSDVAHSMVAVVSDLEEEGEIGQPQEEPLVTSSELDTLNDDLEAGDSDLHVADEIVVATTKRIGVVEAGIRDHQPSGTGKSDDQNTADHEDPTEESFAEAITGDMMQSPSLALATTFPSTDRFAIFSLLV